MEFLDRLLHTVQVDEIQYHLANPFSIDVVSRAVAGQIHKNPEYIEQSGLHHKVLPEIFYNHFDRIKRGLNACTVFLLVFGGDKILKANDSALPLVLTSGLCAMSIYGAIYAQRLLVFTDIANKAMEYEKEMHPEAHIARKEDNWGE